MDMPDDVLSHIMALADQPERATCMTACKRLKQAASAPGTWQRVTFYDLDHSTVSFMTRHRCEEVVIHECSPDDVAWFFERLWHNNIICVRSLTVRFGPIDRVPGDLLIGIGRQRHLRHLDLGIEDMTGTCEVFVDRAHELQELRTLRIQERARPGTAKQLVLWFEGSQARFTSLVTLDLDLGMSDVMSNLKNMAQLRHVAYRYEDDEGGETYEDAEFEGLQLDTLELDVGCDIDTHHLFRQMELCRVRHTVLNVKDDWLDIADKMSPAMESLTFRMHVTSAEIRMDFPFLAAHDRLRLVRVQIGAPWITDDMMIENSCHHALVFSHVHYLNDWIRFAQKTTLDLHHLTCVTLSPM